MKVTKDTTIEDIVDDIEGGMQYLMKQGIRCVVCGESIWGSLEKAAKEKGFSDDEIQVFADTLSTFPKRTPGL
jgi:predicted adenine nucleotide alpha hydrolase (AANH) superfamily ATPase